MGVIALVIVFQQEIRKFLLILGSTNFTRRRRFLRQLKWLRDDGDPNVDVKQIVEACKNMSASLTGALIVIERKSRLGSYIDTGTNLNSRTTSALLESIFNKYSPLHDGAVIISGDKLVAAGCILPVTEKTSVPSRFGLRHRAAIGVAEKTDALAVVVSEETGDISLAMNDEFENKVALEDLPGRINHYLQD